LKVQLLALKKDGSSNKLVNSSLRGKTSLNFLNDEAEFKQVKFSETSYKNGKCRFYLAVLIMDAMDEEKPIQSFLSPSIFLESRRKTFPEKIMTMRSSNESYE